MGRFVNYIAIGIILFSFLGKPDLAFAQQTELSLSVRLNEGLSGAQAINLQSLASTKGAAIFQVFLRNESSEAAHNLFFNISLRSEEGGVILDLYQTERHPFSLNPGQIVYATNNNIDSPPGIKEFIDFEGGFTPEGKNFVNELGGSTYIPAGRYVIEIEVYQGHNKKNGGIQIASAMAALGSTIIGNLESVYLLSPGNVVGLEATVANQFPYFQWQGISNIDYRLIVVEARNNESPESLISGAMSTPPIRLAGAAKQGSLISYEMLDIIIHRPGFQYPNAGVQALKPGKKYYWQVFTELKGNMRQEVRSSEIWGFTISQKGTMAVGKNSSSTIEALRGILGEKFEGFMLQGYSFQSIEIDGQLYRGSQALQKLTELSGKSGRGEISIIVVGS